MKLYYNDDKCPKCNELTDHYNGKACKKCHLAKCNEYSKEYYKAHTEEKNEYTKKYQQSKHNEVGKTLHNIRFRSNHYLFKTLKYNKLPNYEIHHCFSYEDYKRFIYIPKSLHLKIHQYLRDHNIDAKNDHYRDIADLINACEQYTYIHC